MAGVGQGATAEDDQTATATEPSALRIDMDVFATLTETAADGDDTPTIVRWFDCWQHEE